MRIGRGLSRMDNKLARRARRIFGRRGEEGGALLEFAVALPLLLTVLTGTVSFSLAEYFLQEIGNAASSADQSLAAQAGTVTDPCANAAEVIAAALPNLDSTKITFTVAITTASSTTTYGPFTPPVTQGNGCTQAGDGGGTSTQEAAGYPVTVTVSYAYSWLPVLNFSPSSSLVAPATEIAD